MELGKRVLWESRERGGGKGAKPAALAGAQGMNMDTLGGGGMYLTDLTNFLCSSHH